MNKPISKEIFLWTIQLRRLWRTASNQWKVRVCLVKNSEKYIEMNCFVCGNFKGKTKKRFYGEKIIITDRM